MNFRTKNVLGAVVAALALMAAPSVGQSAQYWQCVPFARLASGIQIFGNAHTWWTQAKGKYETGGAPKIGSVLVFQPKGSMRLGHVAVVDSMATDRVITVDHANWSQINGRRGQIEENVTMVDVSEKGDWSSVKVWYDPIRDLGTTVYPTYGFIHQDQKAITLAAAYHGIQSAFSAVTSPADAISQGADRLSSLIQQSLGSSDTAN